MKSPDPSLLTRERSNHLFNSATYRSEHLHSARCGFWALLTIMILLLGLMGSTFEDCIDWARLASSGVETRARVLDLVYHNDGEHVDCQVRYVLEADGEPLPATARNEQIGWQNYRLLTVGGTVPVVYLADVPVVSRVLGDNTWKTTIVGGIVFWLGVEAILLIFVVVNWRTIRLYRDGIVLEGTLDTCTGELDSDHDFVVHATYRFVAPEGRRLTGNETFTRNQLKDEPLPGPEEKVAVLYLNDKRFELL